MSKSKLALSWLSRIIQPKPVTLTPKPGSLHRRHPPIPHLGPASTIRTLQTRNFCYYGISEAEMDQALDDLEREGEKLKQAEIEKCRKKGIEFDEKEWYRDWLGIEPLIAKEEAKKYGMEERVLKKSGPDKIKWDPDFEEYTDSDSEDDQYQDPEFMRETNKFNIMVERKFNSYRELLKSFATAKTMEEALKCMKKIDAFEEKHFRLRLEYKVINELKKRYQGAKSEKEKFMLAKKLNRAVRLVEWKETFDPKDPANYGILHKQDSPSGDIRDEDEFERDNKLRGEGKGDDNVVDDDDDVEEFDDMKERDDILVAKLNDIDKKLEEKLTALDHTFGRKGKVLEEEIRDLAQERNSITEKKIRPMYRKGFDVKLIDMNRTCKVTKGGQVVKFTAILACGNYNGVVGYAKAKGPAIPIAIQKAHEKCFQNLHYIDRYENHTIAHAMQITYKKTKVYLWPGQTASGLKAGNTVFTILNLAGFKNVKSKVIGSRNPHNTVKAVFQALNAIETPKDVQEKFGRTVVESYLL